MIARVLALVVYGITAISSVAFAQSYPDMHPIGRSTAAPVLRAAAERREIHERFLIGIQALQSREYGHAAAEFKRILSLHPAEPQGSTAHYNLALAYAGSRRLDAAGRELQDAITLDPQFLAAFANLVAIDIMRGDLAGARTVAQRFLLIAPDSARALYARGFVALRTNDAKVAAQDFGKLLQSNPSYALGHYNLGLAEIQLQRYDIAERELQASLTLAPDFARARFALGTVLLKQGRRSEARVAFSQVLQSSNDISLRNLADAMLRTLR